MSTEQSLYGYYSHHHAAVPGCPVYVYRTPSGREVLVTGTGHTEIPEDSGYCYPQTFTVGEITSDWQLIHHYTVRGPIDPEFLEDPEEDREEEYLAA